MTTILEKKGRVCENCLYEETNWLAEPCRSCIIATNSNWEPKNDEESS